MGRPPGSLEEANREWQDARALLDYELKHLQQLYERRASQEQVLHQQGVIQTCMEAEQAAMQDYLRLRPLQA